MDDTRLVDHEPTWIVVRARLSVELCATDDTPGQADRLELLELGRETRDMSLRPRQDHKACPPVVAVEALRSHEALGLEERSDPGPEDRFPELVPIAALKGRQPHFKPGCRMPPLRVLAPHPRPSRSSNVTRAPARASPSAATMPV